MKLKIFILLLLANSASAADLRLVSTNLYDFSGAGPIYHVRGTVSKIYPQSIQISIPAGSAYRFVKTPPMPPSMMTSQDQLIALAAFRIGNDDNGNSRLVSQGQYFSMSPEIRQYFELEAQYATVFLLNPPATEVGHAIDAVAVPTQNKGFYDCGKPFAGDTNQFQVIYRVLQNRIVAERISDSTNSVSIKKP